MHLGRGSARSTYHLGGVILETVEQERDLGVIVSSDLSVSPQVAKVAAMCRRTIGFLSRQLPPLSWRNASIVYKTLIRSRMEHAAMAWLPWQSGDIELLERVQRQATRQLTRRWETPYKERLEHMNLTPLEERRGRGLLIETFKIMNGDTVLEADDFFTPAPSLGMGLRSNSRNSRKLFPQQTRLGCRTNFFSCRAVGPWNSLEDSVSGAPSKNAFKNRLDQDKNNTANNALI
jgi:ribonucleases P/MRP protein subunit RPP40